MEEKIIIKNEQYNENKILKSIKIFSVIVFVVLLGIEIFTGNFFLPIKNLIAGFSWWYETAGYIYVLFLILPTLTTYLLLRLSYKMYLAEEIVLTDKRVYGKTIFGVHIDLPIQSISGVAEIKILRGLSVSTSSKAIRFIFVKNASEIRNEISKLLMTRVDEKKEQNISKNKELVSSADELKKYKELLDIGAITQEEFDAKKKELLGL